MASLLPPGGMCSPPCHDPFPALPLLKFILASLLRRLVLVSYPRLRVLRLCLCCTSSLFEKAHDTHNTYEGGERCECEILSDWWTGTCKLGKLAACEREWASRVRLRCRCIALQAASASVQLYFPRGGCLVLIYHALRQHRPVNRSSI